MSEPPADFHSTPRRRGFWVPATVLLIAAAIAALLGLAGRWGSFGYFMALGIPLSGGFALGWAGVVKEKLLVPVAVILVVGLPLGALMFGVTGLICTAVLVVILLLPTVLGVLLGRWMEWRVRRRFGTVTLPALFFLLIGAGVVVEDALTPPFEPESITTRRVLPVGPAEAWDRILFYEEVPFEPPLLARIGVPYPVGTEGRVEGVGDVKRCLYTTGHLRKRITRHEPARLLEFDVIEQRGIEDRSAELLTGSFRFEPLPDGSTAVALTTTYRPLLQARWVWRPFERGVAHALHGHVLDGMERRPGPAPLLTAVAPRP